MDFHDNHLIAGGDGLLAWVYRDYGDFEIIDFANNWWGTDDAATISELIHDHLDDQTLAVTINYEPFNGGPVSVEKHAWSEVKNMFR